MIKPESASDVTCRNFCQPEGAHVTCILLPVQRDVSIRKTLDSEPLQALEETAIKLVNSCQILKRLALEQENKV